MHEKAQMVAKFFNNDLKGILNKKKLSSVKTMPLVLSLLHHNEELPYMMELLYEGAIDRGDLKAWVSWRCDKANEILDFFTSVNEFIEEEQYDL